MRDLSSFYTNQIATYNSQLSKVKAQLFASSMLRLAIFGGTVLLIYLVFGNTNLVFGIVLAAIVLFLFLVSRHTDLQYKRDKIKALISCNETEIMVLKRNFHHLPDGGEYQDSKHYFSQDIDLFGRGSFYQYCNRTTLQRGSETLAGLLTENSIEDILEKQAAIKELSQIPEWRQEFSAIATLVKTEISSRKLVDWLGKYRSFVPAFMKFLPTVFSLFSILVIALYFFEFISGWGLLGWFFLGLGITGRYLRSINKLSSDTSKIQSTFQQYQKLILIIEHTDFDALQLHERKEIITKGSGKVSSILKQFSGILNALDQRNNMLVGFLGNAFLLWDLRQCYGIECWIAAHSENVDKWFNTIAFFDAYNSLGNFAFNHPNYTFPEIAEEATLLKAIEAAHPLLDPDKRIANDFEINNEQFFIITGANMAGKSTFLRTVSLQIVMANLGLPVCARSVQYQPIKLITSMRTTDSLTDDESYFFSELKRLKFVVDEIEDDNYFIVLDEILKGTNSTDKAIGSRKFIEKLVDSKSTGIIATHDLSLCDTAKELPEVANYYFDAEIINDELHFDYKFKKGICKNMNASFLLKKMEIVK